MTFLRFRWPETNGEAVCLRASLEEDLAAVEASGAMRAAGDTACAETHTA
ncbi:hypothetical protein [Methylobacterium longum]|uniref:Uncharacterized protein n=1 Tax=Methylobacterium longum TaxID=767694 RepID=A0ABT8ASL0_9HYPH|nr:hypothetical protein [Methylobacterium longum]MDN3572339.1 hypothetical protein [Methylobacterium longum]